MIDVKERPILFSGPLVRAILEGRKTQTRRVIKPDWWRCLDPEDPEDRAAALKQCPYGQVGDRLWVREAFRLRADQDDKPPRLDWWKSGAWYDADGLVAQPSGCAGGAGKLRPSIHMPRWASRITLKITDVRVERLQEISEEDAKAEGCTGFDPEPADEGGTIYAWPGRSSAPSARAEFCHLWERINGKREGASWEANPWVWCLTFRDLGTPSDGEGQRHV